MGDRKVWLHFLMKIYGVISEEVHPLFEYNKPHLDALGIPYHFEEIDLEGEGPSHYKTYKYGLCLYKRCKYYLELVESLADGEVVLLTDLDVVPLGDYNKLLDWLDPSVTDACFMRENPGGVRSVNCGFILLRKSESTLKLFRDWHARCDKKFKQTNNLFDQGVMQQLLRSPVYHITTFPPRIISRDPALVFPDTLAYHAIGGSAIQKVGFPTDENGVVVDNARLERKLSAMEFAKEVKQRVV